MVLEKNEEDNLETKATSPIKYFLIIILIIFLMIGGIYLFNIFKSEEIQTCGDGTFYDECSLNKPYFCSDGIFVEMASVCGCPEVLTKNEELCVSKYQTNSKDITLKYVLRSDEKEIDFVVYEGMVDYIKNLSDSISYSGEKKPSREDFKLRNINEEEQRELLLPLVIKIQNLAENKEDQMRIAVSIIQEIPFGDSGDVVSIGDNQVSYSRYPYEVLYDLQGVCGEKAELLAFLLKEMGYGVVLFYYPLENHEVVGIKCPIEYSLNNTGYCFVETTGPSIITNSEGSYFGNGKLSSNFEIIFISEGESLSEDLHEYKDAKTWKEINEFIEENGRIRWINNFRLGKLRKKYGLEV